MQKQIKVNNQQVQESLNKNEDSKMENNGFMNASFNIEENTYITQEYKTKLFQNGIYDVGDLYEKVPLNEKYYILNGTVIYSLLSDEEKEELVVNNFFTKEQIQKAEAFEKDGQNVIISDDYDVQVSDFGTSYDESDFPLGYWLDDLTDAYLQNLE